VDYRTRRVRAEGVRGVLYLPEERTAPAPAVLVLTSGNGSLNESLHRAFLAGFLRSGFVVLRQPVESRTTIPLDKALAFLGDREETDAERCGILVAGAAAPAVCRFVSGSDKVAFLVVAAWPSLDTEQRLREELESAGFDRLGCPILVFTRSGEGAQDLNRRMLLKTLEASRVRDFTVSTWDLSEQDTRTDTLAERITDLLSHWLQARFGSR
jgi:hypothetical protein